MQNHYIIHKTILRFSHSFVEYGTPTSLKAPLEGSWRLSRLRGGFFIFSIATSPSLRDTSPQGEALPRTHTSHPYWTAHMTSLMAPLEGSWRLSRLREDFFIFSIATSPSLRDTTLPQGRPVVARYPIYFPLGRPSVALLPYTKTPQSPHLPLQTATKCSIIKRLHIKIERSHNKWNKRKKIKWVQCL